MDDCFYSDFLCVCVCACVVRACLCMNVLWARLSAAGSN